MALAIHPSSNTFPRSFPLDLQSQWGEARLGEVHCLDAATEKEIWKNSLPGEGWGIATIATASGSTSHVPAPAAKKRRDDDASTAAIISAT